MSLDIFFIKDYHFFVYTAYLFTFIGCLTLYLRAMRELKRNEKLFLKKQRKIIILGADRSNNKKQALLGKSVLKI